MFEVFDIEADKLCEVNFFSIREIKVDDTK